MGFSADNLSVKFSNRLLVLSNVGHSARIWAKLSLFFSPRQDGVLQYSDRVDHLLHSASVRYLPDTIVAWTRLITDWYGEGPASIKIGWVEHKLINCG